MSDRPIKKRIKPMPAMIEDDPLLAERDATIAALRAENEALREGIAKANSWARYWRAVARSRSRDAQGPEDE
jgi:hypothetical protein